MVCIMCEKEIKNEFFEAVSGEICAECLKKQMVYYALEAMGAIKNKQKDI